MSIDIRYPFSIYSIGVHSILGASLSFVKALIMCSIKGLAKLLYTIQGFKGKKLVILGYLSQMGWFHFD